MTEQKLRPKTKTPVTLIQIGDDPIHLDAGRDDLITLCDQGAGQLRLLTAFVTTTPAKVTCPDCLEWIHA